MVSASPTSGPGAWMILSKGMNPIPMKSGPLSGKAVKVTSSMTESEQMSIRPGVANATLDGRKGTPLATTLEVSSVTLTLMMELDGSRSGTRRASCAGVCPGEEERSGEAFDDGGAGGAAELDAADTSEVRSGVCSLT